MSQVILIMVSVIADFVSKWHVQRSLQKVTTTGVSALSEPLVKKEEEEQEEAKRV
jgi:hypothetical protein